ncbi:hypothetical protein ABPG75_013230 [Micractinium tetrahymenae]
MSNFKSKLESFQNRFKSLLGAKAQGYDELNTLERPLVADAHEQEEYERQHGVGAPGAAAAGFRPAPGGYGGYVPPPTSTGAAGYPPAGYGVAPPAAAGVHRTSAQPLPSQADELQELSVLAKDAAEILWEMVAMGEGGAAVEDMKSKGRQLQAQLRGAIGDFQGGDEAVFARAFESFDMLSRCLDEQEAPAAAAPAAAPAAAVPAATLTPPPGTAAPVAAGRPPADEAPLISFD